MLWFTKNFHIQWLCGWFTKYCSPHPYPRADCSKNEWLPGYPTQPFPAFESVQHSFPSLRSFPSWAGMQLAKKAGSAQELVLGAISATLRTTLFLSGMQSCRNTPSTRIPTRTIVRRFPVTLGRETIQFQLRMVTTRGKNKNAVTKTRPSKFNMSCHHNSSPPPVLVFLFWGKNISFPVVTMALFNLSPS